MDYKKETKGKNLYIIFIAIIITIIFLYFGYKIQIDNSLYYKDVLTGELHQDIEAKKYVLSH